MQGMYARIQEPYPQISPIYADFPVPAAEAVLGEIEWAAPCTPCLRGEPIRPRRNHQSKIIDRQFQSVPLHWLWCFSHFLLALRDRLGQNSLLRWHWLECLEIQCQDRLGGPGVLRLGSRSSARRQ